MSNNCSHNKCTQNISHKIKFPGIISIHISVFLFGVAGIFGKLISLPAIYIVFGRVFFAALFLAGIIYFLKENFKLKKKKEYFLLFLLGTILALHWGSFFYSIQISTVAIGLLAFSTFSIFTTFLEPFFFKEKLKISSIILAFIGFFGIYLIIPNFDIHNTNTQGVFWGIISGFTFSILALLNRKHSKEYSGTVLAFYQDFFATLIIIPFLFFFEVSFSKHDILLLVILGVVFTAISHVLFIQGLRTVKAQTASIISNLEPVYGIIFAFIILNEQPNLITIVGGILILSTSLYATLEKKINSLVTSFRIQKKESVSVS